MIYYRCKCGKRESWSSMGSPSCVGCPDCGVTLEEHPDDHQEPIPHNWLEPKWVIDPKTGDRWQERICGMCYKRERIIPGETAGA